MKRRALFFFLIGIAWLRLGSQPLCAATFNVANGDVVGLKSALNTANINAEDDIILLAANGTFTLTARDNALNGLPQIGPDGGHTLIIKGGGSTIQRSSVGGTPTFRIFYVNSGANLSLSGLILTNGNLVAHGGAIYNDAETANATLTISGCTITGNSGDYGGAIYNDGYNAGANPSSGILTITNSTISGNHATQYGGAIWNDGSFGSVVLNISNSTFSQNSANLDTGAIHHDAFTGSATGGITNCTFDQNSVGRNGGAVFIDGETGNAMLSINSCTFSQNSAVASGGGVYVSTGTAGGIATLQLRNNIFKTGANGANLVNNNGTITSQGHNLSNDAAGGDGLPGPGGFLNQAGDLRNTDPLLNPSGLQNNGGPTPTVALLSNSPAIDAGDPAAPARDQRYYLRNGLSDIGAFESGGTLAPVVATSGKTHGVAGTFGIDLGIGGNAGVECRSGGANGDHQLMMAFATPVTAAGAAVTSGTGSVTSFSISGSGATVNLTGVTNAQRLVVTLSNVSDGSHTNNATIQMGFLLGDTNGNGTVNASDISQSKGQSGQPVATSNFRSDANVTGDINASDVSLVKAASGSALP